MYRGIGQ